MAESIQTRLRWPALFQESVQPLFVLNRAKRLKFVNAAWEKLTGEASTDVLGKACLRKGPTEDLYRTLAPPAELSTKLVATVRRPAPPHEKGPPWWDVTFLKLTDAEGHAVILGTIEVVAAVASVPAKSVSPFITTLRKKTSERFTLDLFAGASLAAEALRAKLRHAAQSTVPVWIHGEPGSGKETAARVIHHSGMNRDAAFAKLDCAALQPYLVEALLFGTGGLANRVGTLYLASPSALPRDLQQKLCEWLLKPGSPRVISGALKPASEEVASGSLRPEFTTHLSVLEFSPLPLRKRFGELPRIIDVLAGRPSDGLDATVLKVLTAHRWPGNLRELRDALSGIESPITVPQLPRYLREKSLASDAPPNVPRPSLDAILEAVEKKLITKAMHESNDNQTEAAAKLGIFRARLIRRLEALGLE